MAFTANCAFELKVSNSVNNQLQNVPGYYGANTGASFVGADCDAGLVVVQNGLTPSEGYESFNKLNGNTWYMNVAATGAADGFLGDHTGLYAFNNYEGNSVTDASGEEWHLGMDTLGVGLPAGKRGTFAELIVGEQIKIGLGNFTSSTAPTAGQDYAKIVNGKWTPIASNAIPAGEVYAKILRTEPFTAGAWAAGTGYVLLILRAAAA